MASFLKGALIGLAGLAAGVLVFSLALPPPPQGTEDGRDMTGAALREGGVGSLALVAGRYPPEEPAALVRLLQHWDPQIRTLRDGFEAADPVAALDPDAAQAALDPATGAEEVAEASPSVAQPSVARSSVAMSVETRRLPQIGVASETTPPPEVAAMEPATDAATETAIETATESGTETGTESGTETASAGASETGAQTAAGTRMAAVRTDRLPQVGIDRPAMPGRQGEARWQRNRAAVTLQDMPRLGLILFDPAEDPEAEAAILALPVPVSVALPPFAEDAPRRAQAYAAAGHEVFLSLESIPALAVATDLEVLFAAWLAEFPEALGVIDPPSGDARRGRSLAPALIPLLSDLELALVASERGLSPLLSTARQGGVAHLGIYRSLDAAEGDAAALGRILDRVAFEALRHDRLAVIARADDPETRVALAAWLATAGSGGEEARVQTVPAGALMAPP